VSTEILAAGVTAAASAEQSVSAGMLAKLILKPATGATLSPYSRVLVEMKTSAGEWVGVGTLSIHGVGFMPPFPAADIAGPATFRVRRESLSDASYSCGVDLA